MSNGKGILGIKKGYIGYQKRVYSGIKKGYIGYQKRVYWVSKKGILGIKKAKKINQFQIRKILKYFKKNI